MNPTVDSLKRRRNIDRRQFVYTMHIPERRSGIERRTGSDRSYETGEKKEFDDERR